MAINERLIDTGADVAGTGNQEEGLILHLDANDVDSYDGDGSVWYDIKDHEYTPATNADEHFNTVTYNGQATDNSITGVGFSPDLVWVKCRDVTNSHVLADSVRGSDGTRMYSIFSDLTNAQSSSNQIKTIDSDGFTVFGDRSATNRANQEYVAWCFKAGGAAVSNTDGTITSQVSANNDLGFSIVKWTGNDSAGATIGHGLLSTPELRIIKKFTGSNLDWQISLDSSVTGAEGYLNFNTAGMYTTFPNYYTSANSTVLSTNGTTTAERQYNNQSANYIAYCFTSKRGVSKVGSYTGTGATGNKVYTGFQPAWIMFKRTNSTSDWNIVDNQTSTSGFNRYLRPNSNAVEATPSTTINVEADGFSFNGSSFNSSGDNWIYLAFAKNTKETSLIPDTDLELHLDAADFDGSTNTPSTWTDSSANSNNGTISGATFDAELGNWLDFDGSNDIVLPSYSPYQSSSALTMDAWINPDTVSVLQGVLSLRGDASNEVKFTININSDATLILYSASTSSFLTLVSGNTNHKLSANKWHHIAASIDYSSKQFALYLDGNLVSSGTNSSIRDASTFSVDRFDIGANYANQYFNGQIGQVRVYSSALTQDQIRQNFNFTKNSYPNGNDGTITGATWNAGGYFDFDGSNDLIQTDLTISSGSVTTSIWFNADIVGAASVINYFQNNGGRIDIAIAGASSNSATVYNQIINVTCTTATSQWNHLAIVYTGWANSYSAGSYGSAITAKVYLNDSLVATVSPTPYGQTTGMRIGRSGGGYYYNGKVSKVKVFDKELTSSEITTLYNEGE